MVDYSIVNGTDAQLSNVNGGGTDVEKFTTKDGVTLTNAELAALLTIDGVAVVKDQTGAAAKAQTLRVIAVASKYVSA